MQIEQIRQLSDWLASSDIGLLELRGPGTLLRLRNDGGPVSVETDDAVAGESPVPIVAVAAPMPGLFLHRHPLQHAALCAPGLAVQAGQIIGVLQIGELLLPVEAPAAGVIADVTAPHAACVGYGQTLVEIEPEQP